MAQRTTIPAATAATARPCWASINETAEHLSVIPRTVRQMIADGRLTAYRIGSRVVRLDLNEVDAALQPYGGGAG
jgi:excisionase family DNA binding protein